MNFRKLNKKLKLKKLFSLNIHEYFKKQIYKLYLP
jgi:hypothetical protein